MQIQKPKLGYKIIKLPSTRYEEIPEEWDLMEIEKIARKVTYGLTVRPAYVKEGIPLISAREISTGEIDFQNAQKISLNDYNLLSDKEKGLKDDIFYSKTGTIGLVARAKVDFEFGITQNIACLRPKKEIILPEFLELILRSKYFFDTAFRTINTTTLPDLQLNEIRKIKVPVPKINEQRKIASFLSKVDELIQKTDQVIEQTQRLKKGLMQRLLTKGIGHTKFKDVILGLKFLRLSVPQDWDIVSLEDITEINDTPHYTSPYFDSGVPVIRTTDCDKNGEINYSATVYTSEEEYEKRRRMIDPDICDVLYTREAPPGIAVIVDRKKISVGQRIILMKPTRDVIKGEFLVSFLNSRYGVMQSNAMILKTTVEHVNIEDIRKFKIAVPPIGEQKIILGITGNVNKAISLMKYYHHHLLNLKKGLMQKLLTGKIRVKV